MTVYTAGVTREGKWWVAEVAELDVATQARHLAEVAGRVADLIATVLECEPETVDLKLDITLPAEVAADLARADALRTQSAKAQHDAAVAVRSAAAKLSAQGVTIRDIGTALGVSYQRAHQLLREAS